jgi:tetratricopeptide (TPR) repeat protein
MLLRFNRVRLAAAVGAAALVIAAGAGAQDAGECQLGAAALNSGAYDAAERHYSACLEDPATDLQNRLVGHFNRAIVRYSRGDLDASVADFDEALRIQPALPDAYFYRAQVHRRKGDADRALNDYSEGLKYRADAAAHFARGNILFDKGLANEAQEEFTEAIRIDGNHAEAYNNRGNIFRERMELHQALADYSEAVRLDPDNALFHANRGGVHDQLGNFDRAERDFQRAQDLGSMHPQVPIKLLEYKMMRRAK